MSRIQLILKQLSQLPPAVLIGVFLIVFVLVYLFLKTVIYPPLHNTVSYTNKNFYVFSLRIPPHLDFCGEQIPTDNLAIKNDLEREFFNDVYWKTNYKTLFAKAQRWFPVIEPILKQQGVPNDFKYLAVIESHLSNVSSPAGAAGFWQLVPSSAYGYGLEVNDYIDERYHVEKSTKAACQHIKDAYAEFKNWTLAAAAYNRGINGIRNALQCQKTDNYYDLLLNRETGSFVYRILAYKTLLSSPTHFGIEKNAFRKLTIPSFKIVRVDSTVNDLRNLGKRLGVSVYLIKQFNPWIIGNQLINPAKKVYELKLPKAGKQNYAAYLSDLAPQGVTSNSSDVLGLYETTLPQVDSTKIKPKTVYYVVKVDEPLTKLADFFKIKLEDLCKWNNLKANDKAVKGQTLTLYY